MDSGRTPSLRSRLGAVGVGLAVGLVLCEAVLRLAGPSVLQPGLEDVTPFVVPDPALGWRGRPNLRTEVRFEPVFRHGVVTNSEGFRSGESSDARDSRRRILCLGDSFTWGLGVESADDFPSLLERGLANTEVINAGVIGWGTAQEWLWLEGEGQRYAPDALVLGFYVNDFWDNAGSSLRARRPLFTVREGRLVLDAPPSAELARQDDAGFVGGPERTGTASVLRFLRAHSQVVRAVDMGIRWVRSGFLEPANTAPLARASLRERVDRQVPPAQEVTFALLGRIRDFCGGHGIRLVVLLIPAQEDVSENLKETARGRASGAAYDTAVRDCRTLKIDTVELRPKLVEMERSGSSGFHRGDIHLNAAGHRAAADLLLDRLRATGMR